MKKIVLLIILLVSLSGCTMEYNVKFNKSGVVNDDMEIIELQKHFYETEPDDWRQLKNSRMTYVELKDEYDADLAFYRITMRNNYDSEEVYFNDEFFKKYVGTYSFIEGEECTHKVVFNSAFKMNMYGTDEVPPYADKLTIKVRFPFSVIKSNADSVEDDYYIWNIDNNSKLEEIYITYKNPNIQDKSNDTAFNIFIILVFVLLVGAAIYINKKSKKNNAL